MSNKTLQYDPVNSEYGGYILVDKVVRLSKSKYDDITLIHLMNGEVIKSHSSMKTLNARLNAGGD